MTILHRYTYFHFTRKRKHVYIYTQIFCTTFFHTATNNRDIRLFVVNALQIRFSLRFVMKRNIMVTKAAYTYIYRWPLTGNMADDIARALGHSSHSIVHAWDTIWIANWRGWGGAAVVISAMVELAAERAVVCWTVVRDRPLALSNSMK